MTQKLNLIIRVKEFVTFCLKVCVSTAYINWVLRNSYFLSFDSLSIKVFVWRTNMKKIVSPLILTLLIIYMLVAFVMIAPSYNNEGFYLFRQKISEKVDCEKYQLETYKTVREFEIKQPGRYVVDAEWYNDSDMVVGYTILSSEGEVKAYCTGNEVKMETLPIYLEQGNYKVIFYYMAKDADFNEFCGVIGEKLTFEYPHESGICTIMGDYGIQLVGPGALIEGFYVLSMIAALMGCVLALFTLILEYKK